jgi:CheY-like chemotaxis protein
MSEAAEKLVAPTGRRILVADDDPERLDVVRERLQREGFTVIAAQDGL